MFIESAAGSKTFYSESGNPTAETIMLLHGIGADQQMWRPQMEPFAAAGYHVLAPDLLGHGQSAKVESLTLQDWERQINDLLDAKNIARCILIGVSMGGVIAQSYAANNAARVSHLILSDTFGELKTFVERALGFSQIVGFNLYKLLGAKLLAKGMASAYKAPYADGARDYFAKVSLDADFDQLILARKAINGIDILDKLRPLDLPALVMVGDQFGKTFVEINRKIAAALKNAQFVVLSPSMDPSNLVQPEAFNREVVQFLEKHKTNSKA